MGTYEMKQDCKLEGRVDGYDQLNIVGWARKVDDITATVLVEAVSSSGVSTQTVANIFRQDLKDLNFGSGRHGFNLKRPDTTDRDTDITVRFVETQEQIVGGLIVLDPRQALLDNMPSPYSDIMRMYAGQARMAFAKLKE